MKKLYSFCAISPMSSAQFSPQLSLLPGGNVAKSLIGRSFLFWPVESLFAGQKFAPPDGVTSHRYCQIPDPMD